jgi:hypothetical protein
MKPGLSLGAEWGDDPGLLWGKLGDWEAIVPLAWGLSFRRNGVLRYVNFLRYEKPPVSCRGFLLFKGCLFIRWS